MHFDQPAGAPPFALSVLSAGGTGVGMTAEAGLEATRSLARTADQNGYRRFWMSEHHAMGATSVSSPALMAARLIADTTRIRLGAAGVMLPNHAPLLIAEQFGILDALAPGRIDLGLGRALGTDAATAAALRRGADANDGFPQQVLELLGFLNDDFPAGHPYRRVRAVPGTWQAMENRVPPASTVPEVWLLGSSPYSALLAAQLGRPYAFALQFGDADIDTALRLYRENFQPSAVLAEPHTLVSVPVQSVMTRRRRSGRRQRRRWRCCACLKARATCFCHRTRSRPTRPRPRSGRSSTHTPAALFTEPRLLSRAVSRPCMSAPA
jgi:luciferase family oxidoreductase group 1